MMTLADMDGFFFEKKKVVLTKNSEISMQFICTYRHKPKKIEAQMSADPHQNVIFPSEEIPEDAVDVKGPDFNKPIDLEALLKSYETIGFQATGLARAIRVVDEMASFDAHPLGVTDGGLLE